MMVHAFRKGIVPGPFSESLIKNHLKTFAEIKRHAVVHITAEEELSEKAHMRGPYAATCSRSPSSPKGPRGDDRDEGPREAAALSKAQYEGVRER